MEIIVEDIVSCLKESKKNASALALIRNVCRARPSGYRFMPKYKSGRWDGYISLMQGFNRFPTGLLRLVSKRLLARGYKLSYNIRSKYVQPVPIIPEALIGITLRDYQLEAIETLVRKRRGIAKMATNSGKTEVMAGIIWSLNMPQTIILVHRKELMYQTAERMQTRLGTDIGLIGDGVYEPKHITIAMVQTLRNKRPAMFDNNKLLMIDECHHASSDTVLDISHELPGAYRYGFSGTPLKHDVLSDMKLIAITGEVQVEISNMELIENGYSAQPTVYMHAVEEEDEAIWEFDYQDAYSTMIVNNKERNDLIAKVASDSSGVILILVNYVEHGKILESLISGSVFVFGGDSTDTRLSILDKMRDGNTGVFIASPIFDEGVDIPNIDTVIIAGGGKSNVKLLQRIGRGMRKKSGDNTLTIHDFIDDTNKYLLNHSDARAKIYAEEGFTTITD